MLNQIYCVFYGYDNTERTSDDFKNDSILVSCISPHEGIITVFSPEYKVLFRVLHHRINGYTDEEFIAIADEDHIILIV
jgi:hypothetical protein